ncbi:MAG: hypothetical protein QW303_01465 [Nitrososphaerota archaeon]
MSLTNHYHLAEKNDILNRKWSIVYFDGHNLVPNIARILEYSIESIKSFLSIEDFFLYPGKDQRLLPLLGKYGTKVLQKKYIFPLLEIAHDLLFEKKNIILLNHGGGFFVNGKFKVFLEKNENIVGDLELIEFGEHSIDGHFGEQFGFNKIILGNILIVPHSTINKNYFDTAIKIASELNISNLPLALRIPLSIANAKFGQIVRDIDNIGLNDSLIYQYGKHMENLLRELEKKSLRIEHLSEGITNQFSLSTNAFITQISYDHHDYYYYPYLDIDAPKDVASDSSSMFNTNGFSPILNNFEENYKLLLFKRFSLGTSGLFVKKKWGDTTIPKLLHHIWITDEPNKNYTNAWGRILRHPWEYKIWKEGDILSSSSRWEKIYRREKDQTIKMLIASMFILEKHGGIVVDSFVVPVRMIPDELLKNKFCVSFLDELSEGTKICYRVMASLPNSPVINRVYQILGTDTLTSKKLEDLDNLMLSEKDVFILPSYYFNPKLSSVPKKLLDKTVSISLWKTDGVKRIKLGENVCRNYNINEKAILIKLRENPRDRLTIFGRSEDN